MNNHRQGWFLEQTQLMLRRGVAGRRPGQADVQAGRHARTQQAAGKQPDSSPLFTRGPCLFLLVRQGFHYCLVGANPFFSLTATARRGSPTLSPALRPSLAPIPSAFPQAPELAQHPLPGGLSFYKPGFVAGDLSPAPPLPRSPCT